MKSTTNSIAVSGRRERAVFEAWFQQETVGIAGSSGLDCLTGAMLFPLSCRNSANSNPGKARED
ncbi:MAG: hypothetical protein OXH90_12255 [Paracoccaceae bacterium]|nr:hypothetical protein [Paracoccaceae bacterium]MDE2917085.1 hypothetical protein [Paracoccaceae bacterium]